jgi:hypothetical protein
MRRAPERRHDDRPILPRKRRAGVRAGLAALALAAAASQARAHDGPPYAILVDEAVGPLNVSVWADPDVGTGTFYFYLEPQSGAQLPQTDIDVYVRPRDREVEETHFVAELADEDQPYQMVVKVEFPTREWWNSRFELSTPDGGGELAKEVEVTPPGLGWFDLVWYLTPFIAIAVLFGKAILTRRAYYAREAAEEGEHPALSEPT